MSAGPVESSSTYSASESSSLEREMVCPGGSRSSGGLRRTEGFSKEHHGVEVISG